MDRNLIMGRYFYNVTVHNFKFLVNFLERAIVLKKIAVVNLYALNSHTYKRENNCNGINHM